MGLRGYTFMWIAAVVAHYVADDGKALLPVALMGLLAVSYVMRPADRRAPRGDLAESDLDLVASDIS